MTINSGLIEIPAVTVTHSWQGYIVSDPFMGAGMAIAICETRDEAIEIAEDWAAGAELVVKVLC